VASPDVAKTAKKPLRTLAMGGDEGDFFLLMRSVGRCHHAVWSGRCCDASWRFVTRNQAILLLGVVALVVGACGGGATPDTTEPDTTEPGDETVTTHPVEEPGTESASPSEAVSTTTVQAGQTGGIAETEEFIYLEDQAGSWSLKVFYPTEKGHSPLIMMISPAPGWVDGHARILAELGAVIVVVESWATTADPALWLTGDMNRPACALGWAQAHADDYGAIAGMTTVDGYSGGAMPAAWVALGVADDSSCEFNVSERPVGLVAGESQFLFHNERWDPAFVSGDPEPPKTLDGLLNPERWNASSDLRVGLWSAENPIGETRALENPPADDSWIWLRDTATPVVDDLISIGALDDERIDWSDNARLMTLRMEQAGIDVQNQVYNIGHDYSEEVYDLVFSIQP
jgi:hypothetical protein